METAQHTRVAPEPTALNVMAAKAMLTVKQFATKYPAFKESSLRWMIFNRESNGFAHCFCKAGPKRILIDEAAFFAKIESNRMG